MLTRPRRFIDRDAPDELVYIEPDAEAVEHRTRDLGVPDGVWWGATALGGVAAMFGVLAGLLPVSEVAASSLAGGAAVAVWTVGARRWGHRRFRWRAALVDGLWFGLLATIGLLIHVVAQRLFDVLTA